MVGSIVMDAVEEDLEEFLDLIVFSLFWFRDICAKKGHVVIFFSFEVLLVKFARPRIT
jgi:hypothetical protein